jgi:hypothetical protein
MMVGRLWLFVACPPARVPERTFLLLRQFYRYGHFLKSRLTKAVVVQWYDRMGTSRLQTKSRPKGRLSQRFV